MPTQHQTPAIEDRAVDVQQILADQGLHRAPSIPTALLGATAELASLTVLHVDKDFNRIASVTKQAVDGDITNVARSRQRSEMAT